MPNSVHNEESFKEVVNKKQKFTGRIPFHTKNLRAKEIIYTKDTKNTYLTT